VAGIWRKPSAICDLSRIGLPTTFPLEFGWIDRLARLFERQDLQPEFMDSIDESVQLCLVSNRALQYGRPFVALHCHAVEEVRETRIELAAHNDSVVRVFRRDLHIDRRRR
jgi:hypothetical protein